jgi:hypothetical protein
MLTVCAIHKFVPRRHPRELGANARSPLEIDHPEPKASRRRDELDGLASVMQGIPWGGGGERTTARAAARERVWDLAGDAAPGAGRHPQAS